MTRYLEQNEVFQSPPPMSPQVTAEETAAYDAWKKALHRTAENAKKRALKACEEARVSKKKRIEETVGGLIERLSAIHKNTELNVGR